MGSSIYWGSVWHGRNGQHAHEFEYPFFFFSIDLKEALGGFKRSILFGFERWGVYSIRSSRHLDEGDRPILDKLKPYIERLGIDEAEVKISLITMPQFCGYAFNPVSFYLLENRVGELPGIVIEVNNTFGERHIYPVLPKQVSAPPVTFTFDKRFYVSPFYPVTGRYTVQVERFGSELSIRVELRKEDKLEFSASFVGRREPLTTAAVARTLLKFPATSVLTMVRILIEAVRLRYGAGARPYDKPQPSEPDTIRVQNNIIHRSRLWVLSWWR